MSWDFSAILPKIYELLTVYGIKVIAALAIFIIGRWVAKGLRRFIRRMMRRSKVDETLISFVVNLAYVALLAFVIIAALNQLGIQTASFIAILGAAGLAIGLALQGSLQNFAAGVLIVLFRPYKVGDWVKFCGVEGTVEEIGVRTTRIRTFDDTVFSLPNAEVVRCIVEVHRDLRSPPPVCSPSP